MASFVSLAWLVVTVVPAAAQSADGGSADSPAWRITATALLIAFIAGVVALFLTRWRRLFTRTRP